jgi:hypothetical protein
MLGVMGAGAGCCGAESYGRQGRPRMRYGCGSSRAVCGGGVRRSPLSLLGQPQHTKLLGVLDGQPHGSLAGRSFARRSHAVVDVLSGWHPVRSQDEAFAVGSPSGRITRYAVWTWFLISLQPDIVGLREPIELCASSARCKQKMRERRLRVAAGRGKPSGLECLTHSRDQHSP